MYGEEPSHNGVQHEPVDPAALQARDEAHVLLYEEFLSGA